MKNLGFKRVMILGRPGSGKSTFANWLSKSTGLPLHHLDKHFFKENWIERDYSEFIQIQQNIVNSEYWIIDGNSMRSLRMRFCKADLILYFNFSKVTCYIRIIKRFLRPNKLFDDRALGCKEKITFSLLRYMWSFEQRVSKDIKYLKQHYPHTIFKEIQDDEDLNKLKIALFQKRQLQSKISNQ